MPSNLRGVSCGALRRLERRMSMESVTSLHDRQQQQEQRLLNYVVDGIQPKLSKATRQTARAVVDAQKGGTGATELSSKEQDNSLKDLVAEFEQSFL